MRTSPDPSTLPASTHAGSLRRWAPWVGVGALLVLSVVALRVEGQPWWCACGEPGPWITDVWTRHCSQHWADPYSITHVSHGLIFYALFAWLTPRLRLGWRLAGAVAIATLWEIVENSPPVIERYRTATMSLEYLGDSVANGVGDTLSCVLGFFIAHRAGLLAAAAIFVATELLLLWLIRDNLTLNVVMLLWPLDAVKAWQSAGQAVG